MSIPAAGPRRSVAPQQQAAPATPANLSSGSRGAPVSDLQQQLNAAGFNSGPVDGKFGPITRAAVESFQRANGLQVDGIVGPQTQAALARVRGQPPAAWPKAPPVQRRAPASDRTVGETRARQRAGEVAARDRVDQQVGPQGPTAPSGPAAPTGSTPSRDVVGRLDPEHNPRYLPHNGSTFCNVFTQDYMTARGVTDFPHRMANATNDWLNNEGAQHGWRQVSGQEAQDFVNAGGVGLVSRRNPSGPHGHIAPIIEGDSVNGMPMIANAGSRNFNSGPASQSGAFRRSGTEFWVHDPQ